LTGSTHAIIGACAAVPVAILAGGHLALPLCAAAGAFGGLLPDIDHPHSTLGRWVPWPGVAVENHHSGFVAHGRRWFGRHTVWHRAETHSVGAAGMAAVLTMVATWWPMWRLLAWASHLHDLPPTHLGFAAGGLAMALAASVLTGYLSHLLADALNVSPQMLWWPFSRRMVHIPRWHGLSERSAAGQWAEVGAVLVGLVFAIGLWGGRPA